MEEDHTAWYSTTWVQHLRSPGSTASFAQHGIHARKPLQPASLLRSGLNSSGSAVPKRKHTAGWPVSSACNTWLSQDMQWPFFPHTSLFQIFSPQPSSLLLFQAYMCMFLRISSHRLLKSSSQSREICRLQAENCWSKSVCLLWFLSTPPWLF